MIDDGCFRTMRASKCSRWTGRNPDERPGRYLESSIEGITKWECGQHVVVIYYNWDVEGWNVQLHIRKSTDGSTGVHVQLYLVYDDVICNR